MAKLYLLANVHTIESILTNGTLPDKLPSYLPPQKLRGYPRQELITLAETIHNPRQCYILELAVPDEQIARTTDKTHPVFSNPGSEKVNAQIDTQQIQQVIVITQRGEKLLRRIFRGRLPYPIRVQPDFFKPKATTVRIPDGLGEKSKPGTAKLDDTDLPTYYMKVAMRHIHSIARRGVLPKEATNREPEHRLCCYSQVAHCYHSEQIPTVKPLVTLSESQAIETEQINASFAILQLRPTNLEDLLYALRPISPKSHDAQVVAVNRIYPTWIQQFIVFSDAAEASLGRIFHQQPMALVSRMPPPKLLSQPAAVSRPKRSAHTTLSRTPAIKKPRKALINFRELFRSTELCRIATHQEHLQLLRYGLSLAKYSVLLTSHQVSAKCFQQANLFTLMQRAKMRGVSIYIYYNDNYDINKELLEFFELNAIYIDSAFTHAKVFAVDKLLIAAGSYNWLSTQFYQARQNGEGTLVHQGEAARDLIQDVWQQITYHRHAQFGNTRKLERQERDPDFFSALSYTLTSRLEIEYLPSIEAHCDFLINCLEMARHRVVICSPFVSNLSDLTCVLDLKLLEETLKKSVEILFICGGESTRDISQFQHYLSLLHHRNVQLFYSKHFHQKTVIVDKRLIAEGSYNWLSSSKRISDLNNQEVTLVAQGTDAERLIKHFYHSDLGQELVSGRLTKMPLDSPETTTSAATSWRLHA